MTQRSPGAVMGRRRLPSRRSSAERNRLVEQNLQLAHWCLRPYMSRFGSSEVLDDLRQAAYVGLMRAGDLWDETRGTKFTTYAVPHIRQAILLAIAAQAVVRAPDQRGAHKQPARHTRSLTDYEEETLPEPLCRSQDGELHELLERAIGKLKPRHRAVIRGVLRGDRLRETGKRLGISKEAVRQNINRAMRLLAKLVPVSLLG